MVVKGYEVSLLSPRRPGWTICRDLYVVPKSSSTSWAYKEWTVQESRAVQSKVEVPPRSLGSSGRRYGRGLRRRLGDQGPGCRSRHKKITVFHGYSHSKLVRSFFTSGLLRLRRLRGGGWMGVVVGVIRSLWRKEVPIRFPRIEGGFHKRGTETPEWSLFHFYLESHVYCRVGTKSHLTPTEKPSSLSWIPSGVWVFVVAHNPRGGPTLSILVSRRRKGRCKGSVR